jgi:hypothetical protein
MTIIDLSEQIAAIRDKYPEYWRSDEATAELRALWGSADCNDCGVLQAREDIVIDLDATHWRAEIHIAVAPNGWHAVSTSYWYALGGGGSAPSVWDHTAYTTRDEAVTAGINELIGLFEGVRDWHGTAPESQRTNAERMIQKLKEHLSQAQQLTLF